MHTHPSSFPASVVSVHTSLPVPAPLQGVVQAVLSATPAAQVGGAAAGWKHPGSGLSYTQAWQR
jgi:hypothetical protein